MARICGGAVGTAAAAAMAAAEASALTALQAASGTAGATCSIHLQRLHELVIRQGGGGSADLVAGPPHQHLGRGKQVGTWVHASSSAAAGSSHTGKAGESSTAGHSWRGHTPPPLPAYIPSPPAPCSAPGPGRCAQPGGSGGAPPGGTPLQAGPQLPTEAWSEGCPRLQGGHAGKCESRTALESGVAGLSWQGRPGNGSVL